MQLSTRHSPFLSHEVLAYPIVNLQDLLGYTRASGGLLAQEATQLPSHQTKAMVDPLKKSNRVLPTKWTKEVNSSSPWPEYPRPQLRRPHWKSLNGEWDFDFAL